MGAKRRKLTRREIGERDEAVLQAAVASEQGMDAAGGAGGGGDEEEMGMNDEEVEEEELAMNEGGGVEGEEARGGGEEWFGEEGDEFVDRPIQGGDDEDEDGSEEEEEEDDGVVAEEDLEPFEIRHEPKEPSLTLIQTLSQVSLSLPSLVFHPVQLSIYDELRVLKMVSPALGALACLGDDHCSHSAHLVLCHGSTSAETSKGS
jgi:hypothetical protein